MSKQSKPFEVFCQSLLEALVAHGVAWGTALSVERLFAFGGHLAVAIGMRLLDFLLR